MAGRGPASDAASCPRFAQPRAAEIAHYLTNFDTYADKVENGIHTGQVVKAPAVISWVGWRSSAAGMVSFLVVGCMSSSTPAEPTCPPTYCQTLKDTSPGQLSLFVSLNAETSSSSITSIRIAVNIPRGPEPAALDA